MNLKAIFQVFPDANILWLHRDPGQALPSYLDLLSAFWPGQGADKDFIEFICHYSLQSLETGRAIQKQTDPARFLNIGYKELVKKPLEVIRHIYRYFNYQIGSDMEKGLLAWLEKNPRDKHGVHRYSLETFGLSEAGIKNRFSHYYNEYGALI